MTARVIGCRDAEAAFLGAILHLPADRTRLLLADLELEDFAVPQHRAVLVAARALATAGVAPDPIAIEGEMRRRGLEQSLTDDRNAAVFLFDLAVAAPHVTSAGHYRRIILEHRYRRRVQEAGERLAQAARSTALTDLAELVLDELRATQRHRQRTVPTKAKR